MKNYIRLLRFVGAYKGYAALNVLCNLFSVIFSLFSLTMVAPFLNVLFSQTDTLYEKTPLTFSIRSLLDNFNYFLGQYIDEHGKLQALMLICVLVVFMFFFKNLFRYLGMFFIAPVRNGVVRDLRKKMYDKILVLPLSYFSDERKGDIISRMTNDVQEIEWSIMQSLEIIFREPITIILFLTTMILMSPQLSLFVFVLLPVAGLLIGYIGKSLRRTSAKSKEKMGLLLSAIEETLGGLRIIKAFTAEQFSGEKFRKINDDYRKLMVRLYRKRDLSSPLSEFLGAVVLVIVMYFGGKLVLGEVSELEPSVFIAFIAIFSQIISPAKAFTDAYSNVQKGLASADRIYKILDSEVSIRDREHPLRISNFNHAIEYRNVSFAYHKGDKGMVLNDINLKIEKGKTIALVGQSGSGKTTLADLLPRFYDLDQGEILVDGENIRDYKLQDLRTLMGIVTQESILFNDTVFNNISFGVDNAKEEEVIEAAKIANAHDFIMEMKDGYQTNIGDRGGKMSGGQRQRLSIARAIYKNPPVLILDEATSALDTESERLVQEALIKLMKNRTTLVIAHRLSTIQHADEIIVMQRGEIIERGKHNDLLQRGGVYKKLYDLQSFA
ncbi:MAG: ABC transporter ATP-binding protein [Bacteroidetes bacterium]|nr:MAG: ABC transporter ATP-binding protein [Bacteroidota bacterium]REK05742.1 MAG: ABC transporter ATP-binding protein [Bacteroidota bacterium]REK31952.1 MAG: ABC transporter ATP-binding protein [Bacteroidota bacterium]REK50017.1 MAG: ABC transporter ATP-binding protein [Bacteroidota bacterium]